MSTGLERDACISIVTVPYENGSNITSLQNMLAMPYRLDKLDWTQMSYVNEACLHLRRLFLI